MSDLEKYINRNREAFDGANPPEGHQERFLRKLEKNEQKEHHSTVTFWRVVAAVAVIVVAAASLIIPRFNHPDDVHYGSISLGEVSRELGDVEFYYDSELAKGYAALATLSANDPEVKSALEELENLGKEYNSLEKQLYESGRHEAVITAMIENFRLRLELIEALEQKKNFTLQNDSI